MDISQIHAERDLRADIHEAGARQDAKRAAQDPEAGERDQRRDVLRRQH